jgi:hypothetical protein
MTWVHCMSVCSASQFVSAHLVHALCISVFLRAPTVLALKGRHIVASLGTPNVDAGSAACLSLAAPVRLDRAGTMESAPLRQICLPEQCARCFHGTGFERYVVAPLGAFIADAGSVACLSAVAPVRLDRAGTIESAPRAAVLFARARL